MIVPNGVPRPPALLACACDVEPSWIPAALDYGSRDSGERARRDALCSGETHCRLETQHDDIKLKIIRQENT